MTYHKEEYTLHNGKKIYAEYDDHNICQITKECLEMLLDLYQQGRADAIDDFKDNLIKLIQQREESHFYDISEHDYEWLIADIMYSAKKLKE